MDPHEKKQDEEPLVDFKRLRKFVIYPALALLGLWLCSVWLPEAFTGFSINRARNAEIAPLVEKAKALGLTYETVLADPAGAEGKPVVWCVQNRDPHGVTVDGNGAKRLSVSNYPRMPLFMGDKHRACIPMILLVEKPVPGRPVPVFFRDVP